MIWPYIPWETSDPLRWFRRAFSAKGSQAELHKDQGNSEVPSLPTFWGEKKKHRNKKQIPFSNIQYTLWSSFVASWNITIVNRKYIFIQGPFLFLASYVGLPECMVYILSTFTP